MLKKLVLKNQEFILGSTITGYRDTISVKIFAIVILTLFVASGCIAISADASDAAEENTVTDYFGKTLDVSTPFKYVATLGIAYTTTVVELGYESSLILIDNSSKAHVSADYSGESVSTASYSDVLQSLDTIVAEKNISENEIVVITYGYASSVAKIKVLTDNGYDNVMAFYPKTYDQTIDYVSNMEKILGADKSVSSQMHDMANYINDSMENYTGDETKVIYMSYSNGLWKIGNTGITADMISICRAINMGYDPSISPSNTPSYYSYEPTIGIGPFLTEKIKEGVSVILLDGHYRGTPSDFIQDFSLTKEIKVYKLGDTWNSYTPDVVNGLEYISKCTHPDIFGEPESSDGDAFDYTLVIIAIVLVVIIVGVAYFFMNRKEA